MHGFVIKLEIWQHLDHALRDRQRRSLRLAGEKSVLEITDCYISDHPNCMNFF